MTGLGDEHAGVGADDVPGDGQEQPQGGQGRLIDARDDGRGSGPSDVGLAGGDQKKHGDPKENPVHHEDRGMDEDPEVGHGDEQRCLKNVLEPGFGSDPASSK